MTDDRAVELEKEIRELNLKLEIERQKNRKLEQESQKLKEKMNRQVRVERPLRMAPAPGGGAMPVGAIAPEDLLEGGATEPEVDELRERLRKVSSQKDVAEQEKWDVSKEVIENKDSLQRLRVKKINIKKDIDELNERLDRKENQNFKSRLELTDLKKEEAKTRGEADDAETDRKGLEEEIIRIEEAIDQEKATLRDEKIARDKVQFALNRSMKIKGEYESHFFAKWYNK
jgi:chromosome segregation ATPase